MLHNLPSGFSIVPVSPTGIVITSATAVCDWAVCGEKREEGEREGKRVSVPPCLSPSQKDSVMGKSIQMGSQVNRHCRRLTSEGKRGEWQRGTPAQTSVVGWMSTFIWMGRNHTCRNGRSTPVRTLPILRRRRRNRRGDGACNGGLRVFRWRPFMVRHRPPNGGYKVTWLSLLTQISTPTQ